jgi:hypothetical protein
MTEENYQKFAPVGGLKRFICAWTVKKDYLVLRRGGAVLRADYQGDKDLRNSRTLCQFEIYKGKRFAQNCERRYTVKTVYKILPISLYDIPVWNSGWRNRQDRPFPHALGSYAAFNKNGVPGTRSGWSPGEDGDRTYQSVGVVPSAGWE